MIPNCVRAQLFAGVRHLSKSVRSKLCIAKRFSGDCCSCNPPCDPRYDDRKYGMNLPTDSALNNPFCPLPDIPSGVFRNCCGEILGPYACKTWHYQNPEYFAYHHMSFYDFILHLKDYRQKPADLKRKPL